MIEEGTIWDPHKSLYPFFIAAAQTQGRNLTFLNLLKDYSRNFKKRKFTLEYNQDKLLMQNLASILVFEQQFTIFVKSIT